MSGRRPPPLLRAKDCYRLFGWAGTKLAYTVLPLAVLARVALLRGALHFLVAKRRGLALARLERVFGDRMSAAERRRTARRHFEFRQLHMLAIALQTNERRGLFDDYEIDGLHHLDAALAGGRGAILATAHCGYTRTVKPALRARGYPVHLVGRRDTKRPRASRFEQWARARLRLSRFARPDDSDLDTGLNLRPLLDVLARNEILLLLVDGRQSVALQPARILGKSMHLAPGAVSIARSTGAPVLPVFAVDGRRGLRIRLEIGAPLPIRRTDRADEDVRANLDGLAAVLERYLVAHPHLWWWSHSHDRLPLEPGATMGPPRKKQRQVRAQANEEEPRKPSALPGG